MIELHHVGRVFAAGHAAVPALSDVTFEVQKGEFVVVYGRSGAGKTTLLRLLYHDLTPTEGDLTVGEYDLVKLPRRRVPAFRRTIGLVFQDSRLLPRRTVFDNVAFCLRVLGTPR